MNIEGLIDKIRALFGGLKTPAMKLPGILILATAMQRPGLSAAKITTDIIENNKKLGINTGVNPDGTTNIINEYTYNIVTQVLKAIKDEGVVHVSLPPGSINITATGANSGGPVVVTGTNITPSAGYGIIR
jgi:hypothetical protein